MELITKKKVRIVTNDTEIIVSTTPAKYQKLVEALQNCGSSSICTGTFQPTKHQFSIFADDSTNILYQ